MFKAMNKDEIKLKQLIRSFKDNNNPDGQRHCFILGSGASRPSGIPTGGELVNEWIKELKTDLGEDDTNAWLTKHCGTTDLKELPAYYSKIYEKRFEAKPIDGFHYLQAKMANVEPSVGYAILAYILANTSNNVVITTNFDSLTEDALFVYTRQRPLVCGHESLAGFIKPVSGRPLIVKIHRDLFYNPISEEDGTRTLAEGWKKSLTNIFRIYTPIVLGYGGNDGSLMDFLNEIDVIPGGMYWCYRGDLPTNDAIVKALTKHKGKWVQIPGFDEAMVQFANSVNYSLPDVEIIKTANTRADTFRKKWEELNKAEKEPETKEALKEISEKNPRTWWTAQLEIDAEKDAEKQDNLYQAALREFPKSHELIGNYASFLKDIRLDNNRAEEYYLKALNAAPDDAINLGNYANLLADVHRDYDKAEEYYIRSLNADPNDADNLGNYALFLRNIRNDNDKAEEYYTKAITANPNHANNLGNYAILLKDFRKEYDKAEEYYIKALSVNPYHANHLGNYANLLKEVRKDYDKAEEYYLKALSVDSHHANNLGNYALFLEAARKNYNKAEEYYLKALTVQPDHANILGNYAEFLWTERRKMDEAEDYYKRSVVAGDIKRHLNKYADFLEEVRKDKKQAKVYRDKAAKLNK